MGRGTWGQLSPFVISCHCFVLPSVCSQLSPGEGKAEQRDSAGGLLPPSDTSDGGCSYGNCLQREPRRGDYNQVLAFSGRIIFLYLKILCFKREGGICVDPKNFCVKLRGRKFCHLPLTENEILSFLLWVGMLLKKID